MGLLYILSTRNVKFTNVTRNLEYLGHSAFWDTCNQLSSTLSNSFLVPYQLSGKLPNSFLGTRPFLDLKLGPEIWDMVGTP